MYSLWNSNIMLPNCPKERIFPSKDQLLLLHYIMWSSSEEPISDFQEAFCLLDKDGDGMYGSPFFRFDYR